MLIHCWAIAIHANSTWQCSIVVKLRCRGDVLRCTRPKWTFAHSCSWSTADIWLPDIKLSINSFYCCLNVSLALKTVERLTDHLDLSDFASKIIHPIIRLLDSRDAILPPNLCKQAMSTLCALITQLGKKYHIFIPMVQKTLLKHRISDPRYNSLVREISDVSWLLCSLLRQGRVSCYICIYMYMCIYI